MSINLILQKTPGINLARNKTINPTASQKWI